MRCPHCKKPISHVLSGSTLDRAKELHKQRLSSRDIQFILKQEGHKVGSATINRYFRKG